MVQVIVVAPPSHNTGIEAVALSLVNTGEHPLAIENAAVCASTQLLKAVSKLL